MPRTNDDTPRSDAQIQNDLKHVFRASELQRRAARMKILQNHAALENEVLPPEDQKIHDETVASLKRQTLAYEKEIRPGYWQRLWHALLNK